MRHSHRITVMGREVQVRTTAAPEAVAEVEAFVNAELAEVATMVTGGDSQLIAILALLNIAESYLALARERGAEEQRGVEVVSRMLRRIDEGLGVGDSVSMGRLDI